MKELQRQKQLMADRVSNGTGGRGHSSFTKLFVPAVILLVAVPGISGWYIWGMCQQSEVIESQQVEMLRLSGRASHLDEVLTMSARMAAATGDPQWERRYGEFELQLDAAIKEVTSLAHEVLMSKAAAQMDAANVRLVETKREAFALAREGDPQAAMAMLHSAEYAEQKRIYSEGVKDFTEGLQTHTRAELRRHRRHILIAASGATSGALLMLFVWVGMLQKLKCGSERRSSKKTLRRSEWQFRDFFENTAVGFYRTSPDGRILLANPALVRMLGYSSFEELTQRNLEMEKYEPQYSRSEFKERIEKEGRIVGLESAWVRRDGTTLFIIENSRAIRDEHGNTLYYEGTIEDITGRKQAEASLRESEEKYRVLVESADEVITTIDRNGVFLFMNRVGAEELGGEPHDYVGKTMWDVFPQEFADRHMEAVRNVIDSGQGTRQMMLTNSNGQLRWHDAALEPVKNEIGEIVAVMVISRDVHEAKQVQEELDTYREKMAQAERLASLGTLSATIAHELSQPLTIVSLSIENSLTELRATSGSKALVEKLEEASAGFSQVIATISRFRSFSGISCEKTVEQVDLKVVAQRIVNLLSQNALRAKIALVIQDMEELPSICSNERCIEQLFFALTENAIQAADGKHNRRLTISGVEEDEHVELRFSDTCGGIATDNIERIFEPFFTTGSTSERTGLGLCIVKRIATGAGGRVHVESKVGKGSTFCVILPIHKNAQI